MQLYLLSVVCIFEIWKYTALGYHNTVKQVGFIKDCKHPIPLNPKTTGGHDAPPPPPLDISRDYSATREALAATLYDNFLSSFPHILTPNLWRPGVRFRSLIRNIIVYMHVGPKMAPKCDFVYKINANWVFFHLVHINMLIFTLNCWN